VPTIYHRVCFSMVGTLSLCPPYEIDLPCLIGHRGSQRKSGMPFSCVRRDGRKILCVPVGQITQKPVQPPLQKYSAFVLTQIIGITPLVSRRMRGVGHRHERAVRCDGRQSCD
jgi:hypothetical protein